jgi:hypothetical protein
MKTSDELKQLRRIVEAADQYLRSTRLLDDDKGNDLPLSYEPDLWIRLYDLIAELHHQPKWHDGGKRTTR